MGTLLDGLDEMAAAAVRVGSLVKEEVEEPGVVVTLENGAARIEGVLGEGDAPAAGGDHRARADSATQRAEERPARRQGKQCRVQHGFDDVALAAWHLIKPVPRLPQRSRRGSNTKRLPVTTSTTRSP